MSGSGIKRFAKSLYELQQAQDALFRMGAPKGRATDNVDIRLAQMCREMTEQVRDEFCKLTLEVR